MDVPDPTVLQITVDETTEGTTVRASGEVDVQSAEELRGHLVLAAGAHQHVVLDLSKVTFMDSAGLGALVGAHRALSERGGALVVTGAHGMVRRAITASRLDALVTLADDDTGSGGPG